MCSGVLGLRVVMTLLVIAVDVLDIAVVVLGVAVVASGEADVLEVALVLGLAFAVELLVTSVSVVLFRLHSKS